MENASEALMMAFGVLIFVLALSVAISSFSQARSASDTMLYSVDETNYYDYIEIDENSAVASQSRIVGLETIVPTLYKYYKENYTVMFRKETLNKDTGAITTRSILPIYESKRTNTKVWGNKANAFEDYKTQINQKYSNFFKDFSYDNDTNYKNIFSFDLEEETFRHEPWVGTNQEIKNNLDTFLNGGKYKFSDSNGDEQEYDYGNGFIKNNIGKQFVETIGEYDYKSNQINDTEDGSSISSLVKQKKKRIIIYTIQN